MNHANASSASRLPGNPSAHCLIIILLALGLLGSRGSDDRGAATPAAVFAAFETALTTKDLRAFMKVCGKPLANFSPGLSCGSLLNEAWHLGRTYSKISESIAAAPAKKAVIELKSTGLDKSVLTLFLLLEQSETGNTRNGLAAMLTMPLMSLRRPCRDSVSLAVHRAPSDPAEWPICSTR